MVQQKTIWEKTKEGGKAGFDKLWQWTDKLGAPVTRLSNRLGSEAFWPMSLDKESDKAARIIRSFCKDGFYEEDEIKPADGPKMKQRVLKKIPQQVIENCVGLCIFTTMRSGLWVSGSGGSGVLIARQEDGSWSPPSGILMHTAGLGFMVGIDIYDCVIVINNRKALEAFTKVRVTMGGEMSVVAGPVGVGGIVDTELHKRQAPMFTYMKSRGFYAGVQLDGTIVIERGDENERFYGQKIPAGEIIAGKVRHPPFEVRRLQETLKAAEGKSADETLIPDEKPPGDFALDPPEHVFGVPDEEDPDPYGVKALEEEGMDIREAGTRAKPLEEEFAFKPSGSSPVNTTFRKSIEAARSRRNTLLSTSSPKIGSAEEIMEERSASPETALVKPKGPPPVLPPRDAVAKADDTSDISEQKPDSDHLSGAGATATEAATIADAPENAPKIEMKDEEAITQEADLAEERLQETPHERINDFETPDEKP